MAAPFPHHYSTELKWRDGKTASLSANDKQDLVGGPPPQFEGNAGWWSPEELLLESISLCLFTTFQALASNKELALKRFECKMEGELDKTKAGILFTKIVAQIKIGVPETQVATATQLMDSAKRYCVISNALKVPVEVNAEIGAG